MEELARLGDPAAANGRVILAHIGNGKSMDTSMCFTPAAGLAMSTRSGDLDPGIAPYLARTEQMTPDRFYEMVSHQSGMLGISETSSYMRDLLALEARDTRAAEALVFAGGIGENAPVVRARFCQGLRFLGVELSQERNSVTPGVISSSESRVTVRVIHTDEQLMIARSVCSIPDCAPLHL